MAPTPQETTSPSIPSDFTSKFKEIVKSNGILEPVAEVIVKESGLMGENFASKTHLVTIKFQNADVKPLNLFMKVLVNSESHTKLITELKAFEKEARFFMKYLPEARAFCESKGQEDLMAIYPKCYYGDDSMIVFENLVVDKGFFLVNKEERQDFEAAKLALTNIAKHHALSHVFIEDFGGPERFFKQFPNLNYEAFSQKSCQDLMEKGFEASITRNIEIIESTPVEGKEKGLRILKGFSGNAMRFYMEAINVAEEDKPLLVLDHGDYHNNNMMFKKDDVTGKITHQKLVDFQVLRYGNPSLDLHYFLFSSVQADIRRAKMRDLLNVYLDTFNAVCESLGYPRNVSYEDFYEGFRRKAKFGFCMEAMFNNGLAFKAMKTVDPAEIDMQDFGKIIDNYIRKVLAENPEERLNITKDLLVFLEEYSQIALD